MTTDLSDLMLKVRPTAERPLLGLTVLVVEDSRFASEAVRLLCLRSGARIRRADSLQTAHRHLKVYSPSAVIIDLGLPDGSGTELIGELRRSGNGAPVILGTSGDAGAEREALDAGADGFLMKPIASLAQFQHAVLDHMPGSSQPRGPRPISEDRIAPDPIALKDDLAHVSEVLSARDHGDEQTLEYIAQFLSSLAFSAEDKPLALAAATLAECRGRKNESDQAVEEIQSLVGTRLTASAAI